MRNKKPRSESKSAPFTQRKAPFKPKFPPKMDTLGIESKQKTKVSTVLDSFAALWLSLFQTPVHLDSALSKQPTHIKRILAQILPAILLKPVSLAEALGIGVPAGEPWSLDSQQLANWRPARLMCERLYEMMVQRTLDVSVLSDDFPPAMVKEWQSNWSEAKSLELARLLAKEPPLSLRASRKIGAQTLVKRLLERKLPVRVELSNLSPVGVRLSGYAPVLGTDEYQAGNFEIQDEGSQLMALFALWPERYGSILQEAPGAIKNLELPPPPLPQNSAFTSIVDACAGAGGKSLAIADLVKGKGRVFAYDTSAKKLQALRRRATRAGVNNIQTVAVKEGFENEVVESFKETAQVVLVDAPCSGWGVLRRNPDIKWRQPSEVLERMPIIQARILANYSGLVAPGGRLVFGVCTFRWAETRGVVEGFLRTHPDFIAQEGGFLGPGPCDGFFMQAFLRVK